MGVVPDLQLNADMARDTSAAERMQTFSMLLDAHVKGVPVFGISIRADVTPDKALTSKEALATMHDAVKRWHGYIFNGQAIGS